MLRRPLRSFEIIIAGRGGSDCPRVSHQCIHCLNTRRSSWYPAEHNSGVGYCSGLGKITGWPRIGTVGSCTTADPARSGSTFSPIALFFFVPCYLRLPGLGVLLLNLQSSRYGNSLFSRLQEKRCLKLYYSSCRQIVHSLKIPISML